MSEKATLDRLLAKDSVIVLCAVAAVTLIAGLYTVLGVGMQMSAITMTSMAGSVGAPMEMMGAQSWSGLQVMLMFLMWWIMMIAMMTPSAAPTLLLFSALKRNGSEGNEYLMQVWLFLAGYLTSWAAFSVVALFLQWILREVAVLAPAMMTLKGSLVSAGFLAFAGLYQLTPLKKACLRQCQSPAQFLTRHHRPGRLGAFQMGCHHGLFCLGCCWALMLLLFVGGVMNLWWVAGLALVVALEKFSPAHSHVPAILGIALIGFGALIAASGA